MRRSGSLLACGALGLVLTGCGPLAQQTPVVAGWAALRAPVAAAGQDQGQDRAATGDPRRDLSRAMIDASPVPLLLVELQGPDQAASLFLAGTAAGRSSWLSRDGVGVSLRDGMLIETRGLGADLMAADVAQIREVLAVPAGGSGLRIHDYLDGSDRISRRSFTCTLRPAGAETLEILERRYATTRIDESCAGPLAAFVNSYWRDAAGGIRRARQWVSPQVGSLEITRLTHDIQE